MRRVALSILACALSACSGCEEAAIPQEGKEVVQKADAGGQQYVKPETPQLYITPLEIERYFEAYQQQDAEALIETFSQDAKSYIYPATLIASGKEALAPLIRQDIAARPDSDATMVADFRTGKYQTVVLADSVNGEERAPMIMAFGLDPDSGKINSQHTLIMSPFFVGSPSLREPSEAIRERMKALLGFLVAEDLTQAAETMAPDVAAHIWPTKGEAYTPLITGASDVASVLQFKWGEGAWRFNNETIGPATWHVMHFALVAIPAQESGLARLMLVTFDPDPESETYEKITKVDLIGPSGG